MPEQLPRPPVTVTGGSAAPPAAGPRSPVRYRLLLLIPVALVVGALLWPAAPAPPRPADLPAMLVLLPEQLVVTQGGVLVVPVELRNPGAPLQVRSASAYAQPVREDPVVQAPTSVRGDAQRRFVALLAPDCRLLQPGSFLEFRASVMLRVGRGSTQQDLVLDLAAPDVRERVASLCRGA